MIDVKSFDSRRPGPHLLVLGGVHGDEICGPTAIMRVLPEILFEEIRLTRGRATFVPICNPEAHRQGLRYVESNLNRNFVTTPHPTHYEARLVNKLAPLIDDCNVLLDLHSYHAGGPSFAIINEAAPRYTSFATALNPAWVISGWTRAYIASSPKGVERSPFEHVGTTEYAYARGAIDVTMECGQHNDPAAPQVAYEAILRALAFLQMGERRGQPLPVPPATRVTQHAVISEVFYSDGLGRLEKPWQHLEMIEAGAIVAQRGNGKIIRSQKDSVIIMPRPDAPRGDEWFYLGTLVPH